MQSLRKKEGFEGQKAIVIPKGILNRQCAASGVLNALYVTDIGYYPKARFHYRKRLHGTETHILIYCHQGAGAAVIGEQEVVLRPGDFVVIPARTPHWYAADEHNPWTIYWMHFQGTLAAEIVGLMQRQGRGFHGQLRHSESSLRLFREIYEQIEKGYSTDNLLYANMCLSHFLTTFIYNERFDKSSAPAAPQDSVDRAIAYFQSNLERVLTLDEIARAVNLSPTHFSYLFRKKTGFPPIEYFNHLKVQKACQYLRFTDLRIKEVAIRLGIEDPYYFSRFFSKIMGMSPKEYRQSKSAQ